MEYKNDYTASLFHGVIAANLFGWRLAVGGWRLTDDR
jgi:hypothetical protein